MRAIKEIILFCEQGDANQIKTWSNVPYFLKKNLEAKGIVVHAVDLGFEGTLEKVLNKIYYLIFFKAMKKVQYQYINSPIYLLLAKKKISAAIKKYENADALLFTTFSQSAAGMSKKPTILFCDWTIEYYINYYLNRPPGVFERMAIKHQDEVIENADLVLPLFPVVASLMQKKYKNSNIFYNGNVINSLKAPDVNSIPNKSGQHNLLFVGNKKYIAGAVELVDVFIKLKTELTGLKLDIIGLTEAEVGISAAGVTYHGYLDKGIKRQADQYYDLLTNASVFINTTPKWGAFSASLEAMYFYTPVIITPYDEFTATFGKEINFGGYYKQPDILLELIKKTLDTQFHPDLCLKAHEAAKAHTWTKYVDQMIQQIEDVATG